MWSLPDLIRLNEKAAANANKLRREARRTKKPQCEHYGCASEATRSYLVHDIFSDDPKGVLHLCERHDGYSGDPARGYFTCAHCDRVIVENYTWEIYRTELDGQTVCLKCAAEAHFGEAENWIDPVLVREVVLVPRGPVLFNPEIGVLNVARCRHVLAVKQPVPPGVEFFDNAEFDSCDGHQISGDRLLDIIRRLPHGEKFCPVLDAAYQFAVSIGIYVRKSSAEQREAA